MDQETLDDIRKFNELRDSIKTLKKDVKKDAKSEQHLFQEDFVNALEDADQFVKNISGYFDALEKQTIQCSECDYSNLKDKHTKEVIQLKKKRLDQVAEEVKELVKHPKLTNLFLEVTLRCNAKCEHCGSNCGYKIPKDEISGEELKKALLDIHNYYGKGKVFLTVTGGEPLMRKDLFELMKYATDLGFHWGMTTNAMLITPAVIEKMKETKIESISISIDGMKETHEAFRRVPGSFDKIIKAIKMLQGVKSLRSLQVSTCVNKKNIDELDDIYQLLLDLGIKEWRVMGVDPIGRAYSNDDILLDKDGLVRMYHYILEKRLEGKINVVGSCSHYLGLKYENILRPHPFVCGAGIFIGSILANGDICVCPNSRHHSLIQGNIKTDSFPDVWENKFEIFRKKRLTTNEKCKKCKSFKYCRGDSFHTWNYDENVPNMCMKEILQEEFIE